MKIYLSFVFILFSLFANAVFSQNLSSSDVLNYLPSIFVTKSANYSGKEYIFDQIDSLPPINIFADLTNSNMLYLDYIFNNYSNIDFNKLETFNPNVDMRHNHLVNMLINDSIFKKYFLELSFYYLNSKNIKIKDYLPHPKLQITSSQLLEIASKFFFAKEIREDSSVAWQICVGNNGYFNLSSSDQKNDMYPLVEGFCMMVIMENANDSVYNYYTDFRNNILKLQNEFSFLNDIKIKLENLRQRMYQIMSKNENLKTVLIREYKKKKSILNFELID